MPTFTYQRESILLRSVAAVLALVCFINSFWVCSASADANYQKGEILVFGSYEQDNISSNGSEEIEWIVLEVQSDRLLLLSRYALGSERYHYRKADVNLDTCSVRD